MRHQTDSRERDIYSQIASHDGIRAREIAANLGLERKKVNHYLFSSPFMQELCWQDKLFRWHGQIPQTRPHMGLMEYAGWYGTVGEFLVQSEETFMARITAGCDRIGRSLNDNRGLLHSFRDTRETMLDLFHDLEELSELRFVDWELVFELRIKAGRRVRIYADVLVITESEVFSLEFKMKDEIDPAEVLQAAKYVSYQEVIFGPAYQVTPVLVLTGARDLFQYEPIRFTTEELPVCSGDMLFNVFDEHMGFLK